MQGHYLLTGASGFLGKAILKRLAVESMKISAIVRNGTDVSALSEVSESIDFYNIDEMSSKEIIEKSRPDYVIHCAVTYGRKEPADQVFRTNVSFFIDLLSACINAGVKHFLNTDTFSGKNKDYNYLKPYHLSKRHAMEWAELIMVETQMKFSNLRLEHIYGPNDNEDKFFPAMIKSLQQNVDSLDLTAGTQRRDFVYISDVVDAYLSIAGAQIESFCTYEVGTGISTSIKELLELIKSMIPECETHLNFGALPIRKGEFSESIADLKNLKALSWQPKVSLKEGIREILKN